MFVVIIRLMFWNMVGYGDILGVGSGVLYGIVFRFSFIV